MQEKGHRGHMEVGEGEGDNQGVDSVEKVSCQLYFKQVSISHSTILNMICLHTMIQLIL